MAMDAIRAWLQTKPSETDAPPDIDDFEPFLETDEDDFTIDVTGGSAIEPIFTAIEYTSAKGEVTRRRITMRSVTCTADGTPAITAICHERRAFRLFRCDRINAFITADGEILSPEVFWRELDYDLVSEARANRAATDYQNVGATIITALAGLSQCDGRIHPRETEEILLFVVNELEEGGCMLSEREVTAIEKRIQIVRPTRQAIEVAIDELFGRGKKALRKAGHARFVRAAHRVANADGILAPEEFAMLSALEANALST